MTLSKNTPITESTCRQCQPAGVQQVVMNKRFRVSDNLKTVFSACKHACM